MIEYTVRLEFFRGPLDGHKEESKVLSENSNIHRAVKPEGMLIRRWKGEDHEYELAGAFSEGNTAVFRYRYPGVYIPPNGW